MHANYHIWGVLSSLFFGLTLYGLWIQLRRIYERKSLAAEGRLQNEGPGASVSVNRTFSSFVAQIIIIFEIARIEKIEAGRAGNE